MENNAIITIRDLTKTFPMGKSSFTALEGINLSLGTGEFTGLIGPSGSGKTTLLNIIGSLDTPPREKPWCWAIPLASFRQSRLPRLRKEQMGFIFQSYNLLAVHTVFENVEFPLLCLKWEQTSERKWLWMPLNGLG
jgi:putative ABC transport system ATP-binding protein